MWIGLYGSTFSKYSSSWMFYEKNLIKPHIITALSPFLYRNIKKLLFDTLTFSLTIAVIDSWTNSSKLGYAILKGGVCFLRHFRLSFRAFSKHTNEEDDLGPMLTLNTVKKNFIRNSLEHVKFKGNFSIVHTPSKEEGESVLNTENHRV